MQCRTLLCETFCCWLCWVFISTFAAERHCSHSHRSAASTLLAAVRFIVGSLWGWSPHCGCQMLCAAAQIYSRELQIYAAVGWMSTRLLAMQNIIVSFALFLLAMRDSRFSPAYIAVVLLLHLQSFTVPNSVHNLIIFNCFFVVVIFSSHVFDVRNKSVVNSISFCLGNWGNNYHSIRSM